MIHPQVINTRLTFKTVTLDSRSIVKYYLSHGIIVRLQLMGLVYASIWYQCAMCITCFKEDQGSREET